MTYEHSLSAQAMSLYRLVNNSIAVHNQSNIKHLFLSYSV